jgi:hypothetical protein
MNAGNPLYDVFVAYPPAEQQWLAGRLLPRLAQAGLRTLADHRTIEHGRLPQDHPLWYSRVLLLVLSAATPTRADDFAELLDRLREVPAERRPRVLVVYLDKHAPGPPIAATRRFVVGRDDSNDKQLRRLLRALAPRRTLHVRYRREHPDHGELAGQLAERLRQAGHTVLLPDQNDAESAEAYRADDSCIVLVSAEDGGSQSLAYAIEQGYECFQARGRPAILPLLVQENNVLPYQHSATLAPLPYLRANPKRLDRSVLVALLDALSIRSPLPLTGIAAPSPRVETDAMTHPDAFADPRFLDSLDQPGGTMRPDSQTYVERAADRTLRRVLAGKRAAIVNIQAPRQTGKSSLLVRGLAHARAKGATIAYIDLQPVDILALETLEGALRYVAGVLANTLDIKSADVEQLWNSDEGPSHRMSLIMKRLVLPSVERKLVLAVDEADRLLQFNYRDAFFALLRSWYNSRALDELWEKLDLVLVIATEPNMLIRNVDQSPFNVGTKIAPDDFDVQELAELNQRYRSPLAAEELAPFHELLGGQPYLSSVALYTMVTQELNWPQLAKASTTDRGPFSDHLRRYVWLLRDQPGLRQALLQVIASEHCDEHAHFFRLSQAGLVRGIDHDHCTVRCGLYRTYFGANL